MADAAPVCEVCESTEIRSDAGFYFCQDCGTQQQGRRETEHDVGFGQRLGQVLQKKLKKEEAPKENVPRQRRQKRREDAFLGERALPVEDYPRWLEAIGSRLCTASKLVVKLALTMQQQFGAPPECLDRSQQLFYTYLQKAGVAFCPEETAQDPGDAFCLKIKRNKHEIWRLRQKLSHRNGFEKKMFKKRIARKEKQAAAKAALAAKAGKQEQQQQEKEEEETKIEMPNFKTMDDLADAAVEVMERVETSLTVRAVNMASCIYLGIDLLLCIVYLATQVCGCRWILLSDIFRWYREGRFNISHSQILALNFCTSWTYDHLQPGSVAAVRAAERRFYRRARASAIVAYLAVQPSSESHRVLAFLVQFAGIPRTIYTMDFKKVLARLVYNLNLPRTFLQHLFAIYAHLPQVETDYGADRLSHTMPLDPGLCSHLLFACSKSERRAYISAVGYTSFMRRAFLANYSQQPWCGREWPKHRHFVSLPTEVKAAALILFALKLFFGLDGKREHQIRARQNQRRQQSASTEEESNGGDPAEAFVLHDWLAQLEMRTHCWQGTTAKAVLAKGFSIDQMERSDPNVQTTREFGKVGHAKGNLPLQFYRNAPFPGCVPNTVYSCAEPGLFQNLFPDQFQPPTPKESKKSQPASENMSKEALFTPLAMQPIVNRAIAEDRARELDKHRVDTFFKQFYLHSHMNLELPSSTDTDVADQRQEPRGSQSASDSSRSSSVDDNGNNNNSNNSREEDQQPQRFGQLFPCANAYSRLPMLPQLKCISMVVPEKDARGFVQRDIHMGRMPYHLLSLPITPLLLHRQLKVALFLSEPLISPIFRALLRHLALAVSETDHVLFFAFLMVESMFFDHTSFQRIEHDLRARGRTLFSCAMPGSMGKPNKFKYKLTLEGVAAGRRLTARTHEFHYKFSRSRDHDRLAEGEDELEMDSKELCHQKLKFPSLCEIPVDQQNSGPSTSKKAVPLQDKQRAALKKGRGKGKKQPIGEESESSGSSSDEGMEREENVGEENGRNNENEPLSNSSSSSSSSGTDFEDNAGPSSQQPKKRRAAVMIALPTPATLALCSFAHW